MTTLQQLYIEFRDEGLPLVCIDQGLVPPASGALANHNPFVEETQHSLIALYPFTLPDVEPLIPAGAYGILLPQTLPVIASEAKDALGALTVRTPGEYHALEIALPGTGMMLDG
jgi:hypothetical protein